MMSLDQTPINQLITDNIDTWTSTVKTKATTGRGSSKKLELYGVKKLRELILELAVRGKLVPQDPSDEPASVLLERIAAEKAQLVNDKKIKRSKKLPPITEEELKCDLPFGWKASRLGDFVSIIRGITFPASAKHNEPDSNLIACLRTANVQTQLDWDDLIYVDRSYVKREEQMLAVGDIVMSMANSRELVGKVSYTYFLPKNIDASFGGFLSVIRPYQLDSTFLMMVLRSPSVREELIGSSSQTTNIANISLEKLNPLVVSVPPLKEQHRIVAKVDELMTLCDQLEQQTEVSIAAHQVLVTTLLDTLTNSANAEELMQNWQMVAEHFDTLFTTEQSIDQLKQTILQLAVMGKLVPQDPNDEPAAKLLERIAEEKAQLVKQKKIKKSQSTDSIIEEHCNWTLNEWWVCAELQELCRFIDYRGKNPKKSEHGVRLITAKNIRNGYIKNDPVEYISDELYEQWMVRGLPKKRDILFITEGHTMGYVAQVSLDYLFALAQRTICLQSFGDFSPEYLRIALMSPQFQLMVKDNETGSAAGGIKASKLKRLPIPVPPLPEQENIVIRVDTLLAICDQLKQRLRDSQQTQLQLTDAIVEQAL